MNRAVKNKALLIKVESKHLNNILNGKKIFELKTWHPDDFIGWTYICSDNMIVARFWFDNQLFLEFNESVKDYIYGERTLRTNALFLEKLCMTHKDLLEFGKGESIFAWRIGKLEIFDKPKNLKSFKTIDGLAIAEISDEELFIEVK